MLPAKLGKWVKASASGVSGAQVQASSDAPLLAEDGIQRSERAVYHSSSNTTESVSVTAYQFVDATGAHAAFSYFLRPGRQYRGPKIGDETGDGYLFRSGATVVSADSKISAVATDAMLQDLSQRLPKIGGSKGLAPLLPTYLPAKGLRTETVKYAVGPIGYKAMGGVLPPEIVGFDKAAEAVMGSYEGEGTLTLLMYPTPQIAGIHGKLIEVEMNHEGRAAGTVRLRRDGPLLMLTTGPWRLVDAQKMVEGIHLREVMTWNRPLPPDFHTEVTKTYSLLTSIAIFCGMGALAAIVLGLFFGAGRAAIRVLQGKPAASEPEFLRIDLSGSSTKLRTGSPGTEPPS
ncbi:hypothetical protein GCM10011507_20310 [Edaphobacter acidisoli]|uniref:Uncharacterized protein n=1 Tax=Edaphobacter acidisoli TaxID=2040573 RepID=A0A916RV25_9BACT|nr:hypothetical protein GCM10011507_20310 [Edaphobacter acidisoli]